MLKDGVREVMRMGMVQVYMYESTDHGDIGRYIMKKSLNKVK